MVDPVFTYVGGIAFLVLIIGSMLYLMYNYEGPGEEEEAPNENVVRGAGPVAAKGAKEDTPGEEGATAEAGEEADEAGEEADTADDEEATDDEEADGDDTGEADDGDAGEEADGEN